jgi:hypothetical protein
LLKGNTASLTATYGCSDVVVQAQFFQRPADHDRRRQPASWTPVVLETNGTVRDPRGIHLEHVDHAVLDGVLDVDQPDHPSRIAKARV